MASAVKTAELIQLKNILYPTDFSEPSEQALPFATALARRYGATIHALHVLTPIVTPESGMTGIAIQAEVENASRYMSEIDSQLSGVEHMMSVENAISVWEAVESAIRDYAIDLIVIGTHGRTGVPRLLLGSVAEGFPALAMPSHDGWPRSSDQRSYGGPVPANSVRKRL